MPSPVVQIGDVVVVVVVEWLRMFMVFMAKLTRAHEKSTDCLKLEAQMIVIVKLIFR